MTSAGALVADTAELCRHAFRAMGTDVELLLEAPARDHAVAALHEAEAEIRRLEALLSRFRPDSELSRLNERGELHAGPDLLTCVSAALAARAFTGGRFDATVHDAVVAAGYDRSFESLPLDVEEAAHPPVGPCGGDVSVDTGEGMIRLGPGVRLDLGGIGKGYAVERACDVLERVGSCLVNAGGDLAVRGRLGGGPWPVGVDTPEGPLTLGLERGAVATTGRDRRRWRRSGEERHHLIDPSTGRPAENDLLRVTVVGRTAVEAEVFAKALFLAGARLAAAEAEELGVPAVLITDDGRVVRAGGLE